MIHHRPASTYHDDSTSPHLELGPGDDRRYFDQLLRAILQASLGWPTIESHWPAFSKVFGDFDPLRWPPVTSDRSPAKRAEGGAPELRDQGEVVGLRNSEVAMLGSVASSPSSAVTRRPMVAGSPRGN